jgi:hypothetical protein
VEDELVGPDKIVGEDEIGVRKRRRKIGLRLCS